MRSSQIAAESWLGLTADEWVWLLQQTMLVVIILGRWLLPKGDLTRGQLSTLLLNYVAVSSDIVDFFTVTDEDPRLRENLVFVYCVLGLWTWSLLQFPFVTSMVRDEFAVDNWNSENGAGADAENRETSKKGTKKRLHWLLKTEGWVVCLSLFLQDIPFLIVRLVMIFHYNILTESNYFFTFKNAITIALHLYRLYALYRDFTEAKRRKRQGGVNPDRTLEHSNTRRTSRVSPRQRNGVAHS